MRLRKAGLDLVEITVGDGSAAAGSTVAALSQTEHRAWISVILRNNTALLPTPTTMLEAGDSIILVVETRLKPRCGRSSQNARQPQTRHTPSPLRGLVLIPRIAICRFSRFSIVRVGGFAMLHTLSQKNFFQFFLWFILDLSYNRYLRHRCF